MRRPNIAGIIRARQKILKKVVQARIKVLKAVQKQLLGVRKKKQVKAVIPPPPVPIMAVNPGNPNAGNPPAGAAPAQRGRPANNTTCDIYTGANAPPGAPDVAAVACALLPAFREGAEASEGDQDFRYTHLLYVDANVDVRDDYPSAPTNNEVYVPDQNGTGFDVVFVEKVNRGQPNAYLRVFLSRKAPTWPTQEL